MSTKPALAISSSALSVGEASPTWLTCACIVLVDIVSLSAVYCVALIARRLFLPDPALTFYLQFFPCLGLFLAAFILQGLYPGLLLHPAEEMRRVFNGLTSVFLLIAASTFLWRNAESYSRSIFLLTWLCGAPVVLLTRCLARGALARMSWWGVPAVILGSGPVARRVARYLRNPSRGIRVSGVLTDDYQNPWDADLAPLLGGLNAAKELAFAGVAHYAIIAMPYKSSLELRHIIQDYCTGFRHILLVPDFLGLCSGCVTPREIGGEVGLEVPQRLVHRTASFSKRCVDLLLSTSLLLAIAPLLIVIAAAIKLTSRGPIFYRHSRCGRDGKQFHALKFRTMVQNGDAVLAQYLQTHPKQREQWMQDRKLKDDPRVTTVGKWLRRYSLDELPQLLNVFFAQMSLVGPRPIVNAEIEKYGKGYGLYTRVLPGITGLWQVSGRNNTTYDERVAFDEYYVRNWSVWLDAYILARTVKVVITADGAY